MQDMDREPPELPRKQVNFRDSLYLKLRERFDPAWIPCFADNAQREIGTAPVEKRAEIFRKHLDTTCEWLLDIQQRLVRDLARYIQNNRHEFHGTELEWITARLEDMWTYLFTANTYRDWIVCACDSGDPDRKWQAPAWLTQWDRQLAPKHHHDYPMVGTFLKGPREFA
jgi:hypothetical protein